MLISASRYGDIVEQIVSYYIPSTSNVVTVLGTRVLDMDQGDPLVVRKIVGDGITAAITTATVPARIAQVVPRYLDFFVGEPTKWVVYDTMQPNVSVTCEEYGVDMMQDKSITHLDFKNWDGRILEHAMLKTDLFPNATNTTGLDSGSSLMIARDYNGFVDVTQV